MGLNQGVGFLVGCVGLVRLSGQGNGLQRRQFRLHWPIKNRDGAAQGFDAQLTVSLKHHGMGFAYTRLLR